MRRVSSNRFLATAVLACVTLVAVFWPGSARGEIVREDALVGWWRMGEDATWTGGAWSVPDASGHAAPATSQSMEQTDLTAGYPFGSHPEMSYAMQFDGVNECLNVPYTAAQSFGSSFTASAWVRCESGSSFDRMIVGRLNSGSGGLRHNFFFQLATQRVSVGFGATTGGWPKLIGPTAIVAGQWYHVAGVFDDAADKLIVYINGQQDGELQTDRVPTTVSSFGVSIGANSPEQNRFFNGALDDVRIYNAALSAADIAAIFNQGAGDYDLVYAWDWIGGTPGSGSAWSVAGNWSPRGIPGGACESVTLGSSGAAAVVDLGLADRTVGSLTLRSEVPTTLQSSARRLVLDNGAERATITVNGSHRIDAPIVLTSDLQILGGGRLTVGDSILGRKSLTCAGDGVLVLAAANTYTGPTTVAAGMLLIDGSLAQQSDVLVEQGATLGGQGTVGGNVVVDLGGHVAPGASIGTLTVGGLALQPGSVLDFQFGADGNDLLEVTGLGALVIDGAGLSLVDAETGGPFTRPGTYRLIGYQGEIGGGGPGTLVVLNAPGVEYVLGLSAEPGYLSLTVVPEPTSLALLAVACLCVAVWRRRQAAR